MIKKPAFWLLAALMVFQTGFWATGQASPLTFFPSFPQQVQHEVTVINIEIPVRVLKGSSFVDKLTINDFEIYEDGVPQKIDAVYLIKKMEIQREEGAKKAAPKVSRSFILMFEMKHYFPKVGNAVDEFFEKVATSEDDITFVTPIGSYKIKSNALETRPRKDIAKELKERIRSDIIKGSAEFGFLLASLKDTNREQSLSDKDSGMKRKDELNEERRARYDEIVNKIKSLSCLEEKQLLDFAAVLKRMPGQKFVYLFYQQEVIPELKPSVSVHQEYVDNDWKGLEWIRGNPVFIVPEKFKQIFADASIMCNLIYMTEKNLSADFSMELLPTENSHLLMRDISAEFFNSFREIAKATGGMTESSGNPTSAFNKILNASESYYLLYYTPQNYQADGRFHELTVKVKSGNYKVLHRMGYEAK